MALGPGSKFSPETAAVHCLPEWAAWIEEIRASPLSIESMPSGSRLYHGTVQPELFLPKQSGIVSRIWFSVSLEMAASYAPQGRVIEFKTCRALKVVRLRQLQIVSTKAASRILGCLLANGLLPDAGFPRDLPQIRLKRRVLLDALRAALACDDLDGWVDNPPEELEIFIQEPAGAVEFVGTHAPSRCCD